MLLYALTIFLSSFLLFQVQPIIARYILPWYGGGPAVWTTCILFFQVLLLGGYAYAHLIGQRLSGRAQAGVHLGLLLVAALALPITPSDDWKPFDPANPTLRIVVLLGATVGLPYLVTSASSPLLQHWFSRTQGGASPYRLFALSNAGSLLGLLTYPFVLEPLLGLGAQTVLWSVGFGTYALLCGWCAARLLRADPAPEAAPEDPRDAAPPPSRRDWALWLTLAACGSLVLLATTSQLTQDVAVTPFLWVLPLSLYLVSLIICFDHQRWYDRRFWYPFLALTVGAVLLMTWADTNSYYEPTFRQQVAVYAGAMFGCCMVCHGELVSLRPHPGYLTSFYLMVALGGALGGVFATLVAPAIFNGYWEFQLALLGTWLLLGTGVRASGRPASRWSRIGGLAWTGALGLLMFFFVDTIRDNRDGLVAGSRNFYGVLGVYEDDIGGDPGNALRTLYHGAILHGSQFLLPRLRGEPISYYGADTGVGLAIRSHPKRVPPDAGDGQQLEAGLHIGVVGLGTGTVAALGARDDVIRFYEINPEVERVAREHFSYLQDSRATIDVVLGDARISLERELRDQGPRQYDLLVIDAFSGDAIPVHLLTREAFDLYWQHLEPDGALVAHITNLYLDLQPVVRALADEVGMEAILIVSEEDESLALDYANWVVITRNEALLARLEPHVDPWFGDPDRRVLWTDDYSNLLSVLD